VKAPLIWLAAFVVGVAGGTGVGVARAPSKPPTPPAARAAPGSEQPDSTSDSSAVKPAVHADSVKPPADSTPAPSHPVAPAAEPRPISPATAPAPISVPHGPSTADVAQAYNDVARILMGMKADEAGKILAYLSDAQFEGLVRQVGPRQAAKLLGLAPAERAASLSRRLLEHPGPAHP
jgi:hypothetical protein